MDLLQNPFYVLTATPLDNRYRVMEIAEERSLFQNASECMDAQAILIHPRKRLSAEIAWLPGVHPKRAREILIMLESSAGNLLGTDKGMPFTQANSLAAVLFQLPYTETHNVADEVLDLLKSPDKNTVKMDKLTEVRNFFGIDKLEPITRANLLAARISCLPNYISDEVAKWILELAKVFEVINPAEVCKTLNRERRESGFPEIIDLSAIAAEIQNRRHYYHQVIRYVLEKLSAEERSRTVTMLVELDTGGENYWPILIEDLVNSYEAGTTQFLDAAEENIEVLNQKIRVAADAESPDAAFASLVNEFIYAVRNWDTIAQPIQVTKKRQGLTHEASLRVARRVRQLAIHLFNEYDKLDFSQQLISMLREAFAEVPEIAEQLAEDANALDKIAEQYHLTEVVEKLENIKAQVKELREAADKGNPDYILAPIVRQLVHTVKKWDALAQSIEVDCTVMTSVGDLALHLLNEHNRPDFALQLMDVTREVFKEVLDFEGALHGT